MRSEQHTAPRRPIVSRWRLPALGALALFVLLPAALPRAADAPAEPVGPLDLEQAMLQALAHSPQLEAFASEVRAGDARVQQAGLRENPELDLRYYRLGIPRGNVEPHAGRTRLMLSQPINVGKRRKRIQLARSERDLLGLELAAKRVAVETGVAARFAEVLGAQRRLRLFADLVRFVETKREWVAGLVGTGTMRKLELHQITRQLGLARIEHQRATNELAAVRYRLAASWGSLAPQFSEAVGELERLPAVPDLDTLILLAQEGPAIERSEIELARSQAALRLAKAERIPDLRLGAGARWQEGENDQDYLADLEITLPIVNTGKSAILEAQHGMARARAERKATEAEIASKIAEAYYRLVAHRTDRETLGEQVVPAARATAEALELGFDNGATSLEDLLDARRDLARAEVDLCDALVEYHRSLAELGTLVGRSLLP